MRLLLFALWLSHGNLIKSNQSERTQEVHMEHKTAARDSGNYKFGDLVACTLRNPETGEQDKLVFGYYWFKTGSGRHVVVIGEDDRLPPWPQLFDSGDVELRATCTPGLLEIIMPLWASK